MKYKLFEEYTEENDGHERYGFYETEEEIHAWLEEFDNNYDDNTYTINKKDWSVDVEGDFNMSGNHLLYIQVKFNKVNGDFDCGVNSLVSLKGSPNYVRDNFDCDRNNLKTLKHAPDDVGGDFRCGNNHLKTLKHAPYDVVKGDFSCFNNELTTLKGSPDVVEGFFNCSGNNLTSLKGGPNVVKGFFDCNQNELITLEGAPDVVVEGYFNCKGNNNLVTLDYKSKIKGIFYHDTLQGTVEERIYRYINYLDGLKEEDKKSSLKWLYEVDEDFHKVIVKYVAENNIDIDLPGVDLSIASDALKHNDSGLF